jgi:hypothetical protein
MSDNEPGFIGTEDFDSESADVTMAVVRTVSSALDVRPREIDRLGNTIDPDALNALFVDTERAPDSVSFEYEGYVVTVHGSGEISLLESKSDDPDPTPHD